jgi:hypothetical protein
MMVKSPVSHQ